MYSKEDVQCKKNVGKASTLLPYTETTKLELTAQKGRPKRTHQWNKMRAHKLRQLTEEEKTPNWEHSMQGSQPRKTTTESSKPRTWLPFRHQQSRVAGALHWIHMTHVLCKVSAMYQPCWVTAPNYNIQVVGKFGSPSILKTVSPKRTTRIKKSFSDESVV